MPYEYKKPSVNQILLHWNLRPAECVVALLLHAFADDDGWTKMATKELVERSHADFETVKKAIEVLEKKGVLEVTPGKTKKQPKTYRLHSWHKPS
jgi:hypothetical protein